MAMEYLPGKNLRQYLEGQKKKQITAENAWTLLLPALEAVYFFTAQVWFMAESQWSG